MRSGTTSARRRGSRAWRADTVPAIRVEVVDPAGTGFGDEKPESLHLHDVLRGNGQGQHLPPLAVQRERLVDCDPLATLGAVLPQGAVVGQNAPHSPSHQD